MYDELLAAVLAVWMLLRTCVVHWTFSAFCVLSQPLARRYRFPVLSAISPVLFPVAPDFKSEVFVTGFWYLDAAVGDASAVLGGASASEQVLTSASAGAGSTTAVTVQAGSSKPAGESKAGLPDTLSEFLERIAPAKPVCVNFGSMVAGGKQADFIAQIVRVVVGRLRLPVVLIAGWNNFSQYHKEFQAMDGELCCIRSVPHELLFPRCAAVVYHGGSGTVARVVQVRRHARGRYGADRVGSHTRGRVVLCCVRRVCRLLSCPS